MRYEIIAVDIEPYDDVENGCTGYENVYTPLGEYVEAPNQVVALREANAEYSGPWHHLIVREAR